MKDKPRIKGSVIEAGDVIDGFWCDMIAYSNSHLIRKEDAYKLLKGVFLKSGEKPKSDKSKKTINESIGVEIKKLKNTINTLKAEKERWKTKAISIEMKYKELDRKTMFTRCKKCLHASYVLTDGLCARCMHG